MESSHQDKKKVKTRQFNEQLLIPSIFLFNDLFMLDRIKQIAFMGRDFEVAGFLANHGVKGYISLGIDLWKTVRDQGPRAMGSSGVFVPSLGLV